MSSTHTVPHDDSGCYAWRAAGLDYFAYGWYLQARFGCRVRRISVDAGFGCPNVDGAVGVGGCVFCSNRSFSPSRRLPRQSVHRQVSDSIRRIGPRYGCDRFLAYFQPATNTYAPVEKLRPLYEEALSDPRIVGLAISTRPDCAPDDVLGLLEQLARRTCLSVEYGMQTMHDRSLDWMNRGCHHDVFLDAVRRSRSRGLAICAHVILGLPGESRDDMLATARELARLKIDAVKIHNLYAVKNTRLAELVEQQRVEWMSRQAYLDVLVEFLELLPPTTIIDRVCGDAPPHFLIGPAWCVNKGALRAALHEQLRQRGTWQGKRCVC